MGQGNSKPTPGKDPKKINNNDASAPTSQSNSLGSKFFQLFSYKDETTASGTVAATSTGQSSLPPSSSELAKSFRRNLDNKPEVESKSNSTFFLGKMLISPRRPLRDRYQKYTSTLVSSENSRVSQSEFSTPTSLKRKASSERNCQNKSRRLDSDASVSKTNYEEQEEYDEIGMEAITASLSKSKGDDEQEDSKYSNIEYAISNATKNGDSENVLEISENSGSMEKINGKDKVDLSCNIPYSPSQDPNSEINFSLSMTSSASSASLNGHNYILEPVLPEEETTLIADTESGGLSANKANCEVSNDYLDKLKGGSFEVVTVDQAININDTNSEPLQDFAQAIEDELLHSRDVPDFEFEGISELEQQEKTDKNAYSMTENNMDTNTLPRAGTTSSSTTSKQLLSCQYAMTKSKSEKNDTSDEESKEVESPSFNQVLKLSDNDVPSRSSDNDDEYYHHAPSKPTNSSTVSNRKWLSVDMISISSMSSIPITSFGKYSLDGSQSSRSADMSTDQTESTNGASETSVEHDTNGNSATKVDLEDSFEIIPPILELKDNKNISNEETCASKNNSSKECEAADFLSEKKTLEVSSSSHSVKNKRLSSSDDMSPIQEVSSSKKQKLTTEASEKELSVDNTAQSRVSITSEKIVVPTELKSSRNQSIAQKIFLLRDDTTAEYVCKSQVRLHHYNYKTHSFNINKYNAFLH